MGAVTRDGYQAPVLAFWHRGLGRIAALTTEVDGEFSRGLTSWPGFGDFTIGLGRWLLGGEPPIGVQATIDRRGGEAIVRVELDPDRRRDAAEGTRTAVAMIVPPGADAAPQRLDLTWVDEDALEARFPLHRAGHYLGAVRIPSGDVLTLSPLTLPYSPEFEPRADPEEGRKNLVELTRITGGVERTAWADVFDPARLRDRRIRDLVLPLTTLLLAMHVMEIGGRRLLLFAAASRWLRARRLPPWRRRGARVVAGGAPAAPAAPRARGVVASAAVPGSNIDDAPPVPPDAAAGTLAGGESALARARAKARTRMGE
jgi:hypothetical protein